MADAEVAAVRGGGDESSVLIALTKALGRVALASRPQLSDDGIGRSKRWLCRVGPHLKHGARWVRTAQPRYSSVQGG